MKIIAYLCLLLWAGSSDIDIGKIAKINQLKAEAEAAYKNKQYNVAIKRYEELLKLDVKEEAVLLNMAHSYFSIQDTTKAKEFYGKLMASNDKYTKSVANQQIGVIKANNKNYQESLLSFKEALKAMPENEEARHNYELVKKLLEQQKKQQQQQKQDKNENKDKEKENKEKEQQQKEQQQKDQKQKQDEQGDKKDKADKKEQEGKDDKEEKKKQGEKDEQSDKKGKEEEKETNEKRSQRLQKMNLTEDQAKTILDAMKNNEVQYLQQNKKKTTKKPEKGKPDW